MYNFDVFFIAALQELPSDNDQAAPTKSETAPFPFQTTPTRHSTQTEPEATPTKSEAAPNGSVTTDVSQLSSQTATPVTGIRIV